jgi:limonene-1,2-epoxide hydrolase
MTPEETVNAFCAAIATGDLDAMLDYFTADAVYHNIPMAAVQGTDAIRATLTGFMSPDTKVEFKVLQQAVNDNVVLNERVDVFTTGDKVISLPVMGVFEVIDGKIAAWRDYFDLNQFMSQLA